MCWSVVLNVRGTLPQYSLVQIPPPPQEKGLVKLARFLGFQNGSMGGMCMHQSDYRMSFYGILCWLSHDLLISCTCTCTCLVLCPDPSPTEPLANGSCDSQHGNSREWHPSNLIGACTFLCIAILKTKKSGKIHQTLLLWAQLQSSVKSNKNFIVFQIGSYLSLL